MTLKELINNLKQFENGSDYLLKVWLDELQLNRDLNYQNIYGFIRGLFAVNFISENDEQSLLDELINLAFIQRN